VLHEKNVTEFKTLKIAFGLSFFNLKKYGLEKTDKGNNIKKNIY
jgi:hypothetical protein